jgi:type IV secretory pathway VirB6-like protein
MRTVHQSTYQNCIAKSTYLGNTINWTIFHDYCNKGDLDNMNSLDEENGKNTNTITISKSFHDLSHLISQDMPV